MDCQGIVHVRWYSETPEQYPCTSSFIQSFKKVKLPAEKLTSEKKRQIVFRYLEAELSVAVKLVPQVEFQTANVNCDCASSESESDSPGAEPYPDSRRGYSDYPTPRFPDRIFRIPIVEPSIPGRTPISKWNILIPSFR